MKNRLYVSVISMVFLVMAFIIDGTNVFSGYANLLFSPSVLPTDYLSYGVGAVFLNISTLITFNLILLKILDLRITGPIMAGLFTIMGCGFYGSNLLNTIPIYLGIYIYTSINKSPFKNNIISILFSTGITPIVGFVMFGTDIHLGLSIPIGILVGMIFGFMIPAISGHVIKFHNGYNLYNMGFALGILAMLFNGILHSICVDASNAITRNNTDYHIYMLIVLIAISVFYLIIGLVVSRKDLKKYKALMKRSGRLVTDFIRDYGLGITLINMASMGIICIVIVLIFQIKLDGIVVGSIFTVIGFSSFGIHPKNSWSLVLSTILVGLAMHYLAGITISPSTIFLVMGLAPIAGRYGIIFGLLAGAIHTAIVPICQSFQGGFDLFNNGFAAGFVASVIVPIIDSLRRDE